MEIEDQIADEVLSDPNVKSKVPAPLLKILHDRIAVAIRKDRERASRILTMAPLDMSLEQLACLIRGG